MKPDLEIRLMEEADVPAVAAIEAVSFSEPWSEASFRSILKREDALYLTAVSDGCVAGMCGLLIGPYEAEVFNVAVSPQLRGQGIAGRMIAELMRRGEERGVRDFTLEVRASNAAAIHLYEKNGFMSEGTRPRFYSNPEEDALIMWRRGGLSSCTNHCEKNK
ncbi:MAG: ribosomal protein S18-alanine N-acetyltransferase [Lachnospiraceae bacterium]|nr:ribosomal protein S18-alanine N-acetyltransferase [Lachnospiraceae bacterium]